jgi:ubiquinone/menaquinone biosynthesis C-methylase UbiE
VLDVGTGTGILPHALLARDAEVAMVAGCDRSIGMLAVARMRTPSLRVVAADGQMLPFRDAAFDATTASFVLSHMSDYPAALAEMRRVLRSGGRVAITSWAAGEDGPSQGRRRLERTPRLRLRGRGGDQRIRLSFHCWWSFDGAHCWTPTSWPTGC